MDANPVIEAVRIVGGPTKASWVCQVSAAAVYRWYKLGYVPDTRAAVRLADATKEAGTPISIAALAGLDVIEGGQPAPDGPGRGRGPRVPKRPARRTSTCNADDLTDTDRPEVVVAIAVHGNAAPLTAAAA